MRLRLTLSFLFASIFVLCSSWMLRPSSSISLHNGGSIDFLDLSTLSQPGSAGSSPRIEGRVEDSQLQLLRIYAALTQLDLDTIEAQTKKLEIMYGPKNPKRKKAEQEAARLGLRLKEAERQIERLEKESGESKVNTGPKGAAVSEGLLQRIIERYLSDDDRSHSPQNTKRIKSVAIKREEHTQLTVEWTDEGWFRIAAASSVGASLEGKAEEEIIKMLEGINASGIDYNKVRFIGWFPLMNEFNKLQEMVGLDVIFSRSKVEGSILKAYKTWKLTNAREIWDYADSLWMHPSVSVEYR